jgi:ribosomal protein S18 acetylase RimI-like enzyme
MITPEFEPVRMDVVAARVLHELDKEIYPEADWYEHAEDWLENEAFWIKADKRIVGSIGYRRSADLDRSLEIGAPGSAPACFYIVSTGVLKGFQGQGIGVAAKRFTINYARHHLFERMVSYPRKSNTKIVEMNLRFDFKIRREIPGFYEDLKDPKLFEPALAMELVLGLDI